MIYRELQVIIFALLMHYIQHQFSDIPLIFRSSWMHMIVDHALEQSTELEENIVEPLGKSS